MKGENDIRFPIVHQDIIGKPDVLRESYFEDLLNGFTDLSRVTLRIFEIRCRKVVAAVYFAFCCCGIAK